MSSGRGDELDAADSGRLSRGIPLAGDSLDKSIWGRRKLGPKYQSDSGTFIDTERCVKKAFLCDWSHTTGGAALAARGKVRAFGSTKISKETLEEIMDVLYEFFPMLIRIFTYYSCVGVDVTKSVHGIGKLGYTLMLNDARLDILDVDLFEDIESPSKSHTGARRMARHARKRGEDGFDLLWTAVNSMASSKEQGTGKHKTNAATDMVRSEFMEWIVRAATGEQPPQAMAQNVRWLCEDLIYFLSKHEMASLIFSNANWFRLDACYLKQMDVVLRKHELTLQSLFEVYAAATGVGKDYTERDDLMNYEEFAYIWDDLGFTRELTERRLSTIFALSRMLVIDEHAATSAKIPMLQRLPFEGFLEAMVRLADVKALPTVAEIESKGFVFPGEYLKSLRIEGGDETYRAWIAGAKKLHQNGQHDSLWQRLDTLILIIVFIVQSGVEASPGGADVLLRAAPDEKLSKREVGVYRKAPKPNMLGNIDEAVEGYEFMATQQVSKERAMKKMDRVSAESRRSGSPSNE